MATVLTDGGEFAVNATDGLWLSPTDAERVTGWTWKPEGMCRGEVCVPLLPAMTRGGRVDVPAFWAHLGNPVLHDDARETWALGTSAETRNEVLAGLDAPDFTLPDLTGAAHSLSDLRGKKVFLTTWASW